MCEDYVSLEVAKQLKDLGFPQNFYDDIVPVYYKNRNNHWVLSFAGEDNYPVQSDEWYSAPTLGAAMKFMREFYRISIEPYASLNRYGYVIAAIPTGRFLTNDHSVNDGDFEKFDTFEKATNKALLTSFEIIDKKEQFLSNT